jgi:hypothetical protein
MMPLILLLSICLGLQNGTWMTLEDRVGLSFASHGFGVRKGDRRHAQAVAVMEDIACQDEDGCKDGEKMAGWAGIRFIHSFTNHLGLYQYKSLD